MGVRTAHQQDARAQLVLQVQRPPPPNVHSAAAADAPAADAQTTATAGRQASDTQASTIALNQAVEAQATADERAVATQALTTADGDQAAATPASASGLEPSGTAVNGIDSTPGGNDSTPCAESLPGRCSSSTAQLDAILLGAAAAEASGDPDILAAPRLLDASGALRGPS